MWFTSHATPSFSFLHANGDGKAAAFGVTLGDQETVNFAKKGEPAAQSPADIAKYVKASAGSSASEEDVLHHAELPSFSNALSPEESEKFFAYLSARHIAPPLVLGFFSGDRIGQLMNRELQSIVESVLFEPLEFAKGGAGGSIQRIPARSQEQVRGWLDRERSESFPSHDDDKHTHDTDHAQIPARHTPRSRYGRGSAHTRRHPGPAARDL